MWGGSTKPLRINVEVSLQSIDELWQRSMRHDNSRGNARWMTDVLNKVEHTRDNYSQRFGAPPELPKPTPPPRPQTAQEIYDELKLPDEQLSGAYANGVMIGHTPSEFKLDFLTNLFPHTAVSARVFMSAPQIPRLIDSLSNTYSQFQQRVRDQQSQQRQPQQLEPPQSPPAQSPTPPAQPPSSDVPPAPGTDAPNAGGGADELPGEGSEGDGPKDTDPNSDNS